MQTSPGTVADIGILTVIAPELDAVRRALGLRREPKERANDTVYWRGTVTSALQRRNHSVVLAAIGTAGNARAAAVATQMIAKYSPRVVFLVGIAAGMRGKVKIGEVVLPDRVVGYESAALVTGGKRKGTVQPRPEISEISHGNQQDIVNYSPNLVNIEQLFTQMGGKTPHASRGNRKEWREHVAQHIMVRSGIAIASGEKLLRDPNILIGLRRTIHGKIEAGEMEAAGLVHACKVSETPWFIIRGISDFGDDFKSDDFHLFASHTAAAVLVDFLRHGLDLGGGSRSNIAALSPVPITARPTSIRKIIGRSRDFRWLRGTGGDRLLVGQPGMGKTCVLRRYARTDGALFVVDHDRERIATAIHSKQPSTIIVDDAHMNPGLLVSLRQLREELGVDFQILAACWPGARAEAQQALGIGDKQVRELRLLSRDEIVRVIKSAGFDGANFIVRELVNQAEGRAGLAVSLVACLLKGDFRRVQRGEELTASLVDALARSVDKEAKQVLASFAIGGDHGMRLEDVANCIGKDIALLHRVLNDLQHGGVIRLVDKGPLGSPQAENRFAVAPRALQHALIRDAFFGSTPLPYKALLDKANSVSAITAIIGAKLRGAKVGSALIREWLEACRPNDIIPSMDRHGWNQAAVLFAHAGREEARWVLRNCESALDSSPHILLELASSEAIRRLLERSIGKRPPLNATPRHGLRVLADWIAVHPKNIERSMRRRRCLLKEAERWIEHGGDCSVASYAARIALSPRVHWTESDPGSGNQFTMHHGMIPAAEVEQIGQLWARARTVMEHAHDAFWPDMFEILHEWVYGSGWGMNATATVDAMHAVIRRELLPIADMAAGRPAVLSKIYSLAKRVNLDAPIHVDADYEEILGEDARDIVNHSEWLQHISGIANRWIQQGVAVMANKLRLFATDASVVGSNVGRLRSVAYYMAEFVPSRLPWVGALEQAKVPADIIEPFLMRAALTNEQGWEPLTAEWLEREDLRQVAVAVTVLVENSSEALIESALHFPKEVFACITNCLVRLGVERMIRLLTSDLRQISSGAAVLELRRALSQARSDGSTFMIRPELYDAWRSAALRITSGNDVYLLADVFKTDSQFAFDWLARRMKSKSYSYHEDYVVDRAIAALDATQRHALIQMVKRGTHGVSLLPKLIGESDDEYAWFLENFADRALHLLPLRDRDRNDVGAPIPRIRLALAAGHSPASIAHEMCCVWSFSGSAVKYWRNWVMFFAQLMADGDKKMRLVGKHGHRSVKASYRSAVAQERREAVFGS